MHALNDFPLFLRLANKTIVICGGGELAHRKALILSRTKAEIIVVSEQINTDLEAMAAAGRIRHAACPDDGIFQGAALVLIGTGDKQRDITLRGLAKAAGALVNVVDRPELCDVIFPSIVDRAPIVVAVGTEGASPIHARRIRAQIDQLLPCDIGEVAARAGRLRNAVKTAFPFEMRRKFWEWALSQDLMADETWSDDDLAEELISKFKSHEPRQVAPIVSIIGTHPGEPDLLTLRAVQRLQEADVIFHDETVDAAVIDLARRDAEQIALPSPSKASTSHADEIINALKHVPGGFDRFVYATSEEAEIVAASLEAALASQDVSARIAIIPGVHID